MSFADLSAGRSPHRRRARKKGKGARSLGQERASANPQKVPAPFPGDDLDDGDAHSGGQHRHSEAPARREQRVRRPREVFEFFWQVPVSCDRILCKILCKSRLISCARLETVRKTHSRSLTFSL